MFGLADVRVICTCQMPSAECRMANVGWWIANGEHWMAKNKFLSSFSYIHFLLRLLMHSLCSTLAFPPSVSCPLPLPAAICMPSTRRWHRFLDPKSKPATEPPLESGQGLGQRLKAQDSMLETQDSRSCRINAGMCVPVDWRWSGLVMNCQQIAELELNCYLFL